MAKVQFEDAAGRIAWEDTSTGIVYTEGGNNSTFLNRSQWDKRQLDKYGSKSSKSNDPAAAYANALVDPISARIKEQTKFIDKYTTQNPFAFDEELAKESATAEYEPYYNRILSDYMEDISMRRETIQDDKALADSLKKMDDVSTNRSFVDAIQKTREGYAGRGLYDSGFQATDEGRSTVDYQDTMERSNLTADNRNREYDRNFSYLDTLASRKERDTADEKKAAIEGGVLTRENEAVKAYNVPFTQAYQRAFPSNSTDVLSGYLVPEALRY